MRSRQRVPIAAIAIAVAVALAPGMVVAQPTAAAPVADAPPAEPTEPEDAIASEPEPQGSTPLEPDASMGNTRIDLVGGAPGELELFRIDPDASRPVGRFEGVPYVRVCRAPCRKPVFLEDGDYFVAGKTVMPSRTFELEEQPGHRAVRLEVRPGRRAIRFAGFGLLVSGAILVPGGGLLVGAVHRDPGSDIAGFVLIGTGVVALATGIALVIRGRTLVHVAE